jgi:hypothetical protein
MSNEYGDIFEGTDAALYNSQDGYIYADTAGGSPSMQWYAGSLNEDYYAALDTRIIEVWNDDQDICTWHTPICIDLY